MAVHTTRSVTCDSCGKTETVVDTPRPEGWELLYLDMSNHAADVCSRDCASNVLHAEVEQRLDDLYAVPA